MKNVLSIAGFDGTACAGLMIDLEVIKSLSAKPLGAASCLSVQTSRGLTDMQSVDNAVLKAQLDAIRAEHDIDAIKIGLVLNSSQAKLIADFAENLQVPIVYDPVFRSTSGYRFLDPSDWREAFLTIANVATLVILNREERELIKDLGNDRWPVLFTGGDAETPDAVDEYRGEGERFSLTCARQPFSVRGTGCALSAAIATHLAGGLDLRNAVVLGKSQINQWIRTSTPTKLGRILSITSDQQCAEDFPRLEDGESIDLSFVSLEGPIGVYPIVETIAQLQQVLAAHVSFCQLRTKSKDRAFLAQQVMRAKDLCLAADCKLFLNDYWDLAIEHGVYGVHLGQEDLETADLRAIAQAGLRLGISTHDYCEAARASTLQPSYIALGPIFETTCKAMRFGPQGLARIQEWRQRLSAPLVAIGGLREEHVMPVRTAGAQGIAVISDILQSTHPTEKTAAWMAAWAD